MATTAKALAFARALKDELTLRVSSLTTTLSFDTDGSPVLTIGTAVAGTPGGLIKVMPIERTTALDILGLASQVYSPHKIQVVFEANNAAGAAADVNTWAVRLPIIACALAKGCRTEVYESANATAPVVAQITAANLKATFEGSLEYGMIASQ